MPTKNNTNGAAILKQDIQKGTIKNCYVIYGEESYLKEHYLKELIAKTVEPTFAEFNYQQFDGKEITPEQLLEAVDSYPAMAERKLVLIRDFDLYKTSAAFKEVLPQLLADLPTYICLVFYYDVLELKADKRLKIHTVLTQNSCFAEFAHLAERELIDWIRRCVHRRGKRIDDSTCAYLIFHCGNSMTYLLLEIEKAVAFSTVDTITQYHIDTICTRVLTAVIFDLTDAIAERNSAQVFILLQDLLMQKNDEIQIFSAILRHLQRLYGAKLVEQSRGGEAQLIQVLGVKSTFYACKMAASSRKISLKGLRHAVLIAAQIDTQLKSSIADRRQLIELALLQFSKEFE